MMVLQFSAFYCDNVLGFLREMGIRKWMLICYVHVHLTFCSLNNERIRDWIHVKRWMF